MVVSNHPDLRAAMYAAHMGTGGTRDELLALARRHGQTPEIFDADYAEMGRRIALHNAYWSSPEGLAIRDARQKLAEAAQAVDAAVAEFASDARVDHLRKLQADATAEVNKLQNANSEQFQAFSKAMKATAHPGDANYLDPANVLIH